MSQESNVSELSHTLSDGTMNHLRELVGDVHDDYVSTEMLDTGDCSRQMFFQDEFSGSQLNCLSDSQEQQNMKMAFIMPRVPQSPVDNPLVSHPIHFSCLQTRENIPGNLGFELRYEPETMPLRKATAWTYSQSLNKMYAKNKVDIPLRFTLRDAAPQDYDNLYIRAVVVYSKTENSRTPVMRCPNHECSDSRKHIMECGNSNSVYGVDSNDGHFFVLFPLRCPSAGQEYILEFLRFSCLNTCPGGPDRREFHCVFLLEQNNEVVGKRILDIKISTTPGRDRPKEEAKVMNGKTRLAPKVKQEPVPVNQGIEQKGEIKEEDDDEIYTIQVRGKKKYNELMKHKEALELQDLIPEHILQNYRASCLPCGPNWLLEQQKQENNPTVQTPATSTVVSQPSTSTSILPLQKNAVRFTMKRQTKKQEVTEKRSVTISLI